MEKIISAALAVIMCALSAFALASCGEDKAAGSLSSSSMPDFQYQFKIMGAQTPTQKSDNGYYNIINYNIIYTDGETLTSTPLCNKSDCLHNGDFPDCNGKVDDWALCFDNFQIYRDKIYYIAANTDSSVEGEINYLKSVSLDGSQKDTVLTLEDKFITDWFIYGGYFYYQPSVTVDSENGETQSGNFYRIDLDTKSEEIFADFSDIKGIYGATGSMRNVYEGRMYVTLYGYATEGAYEKVINGEEIDGDISTVRKIASYSLADGALTIIDPEPYNHEYEFIGFTGGRLLGTDLQGNEKTVCISDLDGANPKEVVTVDSGYQVFCDDKNIYVLNHSVVDESAGDKTVTVYGTDGNRLSEASVPAFAAENMSMTAFYDDYLWFSAYSESGEAALYCIDKADLMKDGAEVAYKEVYREAAVQ